MLTFRYSQPSKSEILSCPKESYDALESPEDKRQVLMVQDTLKLGGAILSKIPDMLAAQVRAKEISVSKSKVTNSLIERRETLTMT